MAHSLAKIYLHIVFTTKHRAKLILDEFEPELHAYLVKACSSQGSYVYKLNGVSNHIHIACTLPRTLTVSKLLEEVKTSSSRWMRRRDPRCANFGWQNGYAAFSISQSHLDRVVRYIERQKEHHNQKTVESEVISLLKKYQVDYDEKYLWD